MNITLEFYGRLRSQFSEQALPFKTEHKTVQAIFKQLSQAHDQDDNHNGLKPIINDAFADWQDEVTDGDVLGFLPPASGG